MEAKSSQRRLSARDKEVACLDLRRKGYSYTDIGRELRIDRITAFAAVKRALQRLNEDILESAAEVRRLELERMDAFLKALEPACAAGDTKAIGTALRVSERRAGLLGLDAPKQAQVEIKPTTDVEALKAELLNKLKEMPE